jgi:hypothetical protein
MNPVMAEHMAPIRTEELRRRAAPYAGPSPAAPRRRQWAVVLGPVRITISREVAHVHGVV